MPARKVHDAAATESTARAARNFPRLEEFLAWKTPCTTYDPSDSVKE